MSPNLWLILRFRGYFIVTRGSLTTRRLFHFLKQIFCNDLSACRSRKSWVQTLVLISDASRLSGIKHAVVGKQAGCTRPDRHRRKSRLFRLRVFRYCVFEWKKFEVSRHVVPLPTTTAKLRFRLIWKSN